MPNAVRPSGCCGEHFIYRGGTLFAQGRDVSYLCGPGPTKLTEEAGRIDAGVWEHRRGRGACG